MPLTIQQICDTCCSGTFTEAAFYDRTVRLLCGISQAEAVAGSACYDMDPPNLDYGCAIRLLERAADGSFTGDMRYIDSETGATVDPLAIVDCPGIDCDYFTGL